jgi:hypothetical protein
MLNNILLLFIKICHLLILLFILLTPFQNLPILLLIHMLFSILLLIHWYNQSDVCFLTYLESYITNTNVNDGFIYKIISPFYNISKIKVRQMVWTMTILLLFISSHKFIIYVKENCKESIYKCVYNAYIKNNL